MNRDIELSDEFREVIERRYAFAIHFTRACRERKIGLPADFLKLQFKDLITPSGILITTLEGHTDAVYCLTVVGNKLYTGSDDRTIRVWDIDTHQHITALEGHTDDVYCLTVVGNKLYSGSFDRTIRVWDTDTHQHIATLEGHTDGVCYLTVVGNKLYSGSVDKTIRAWTLF